MAPSATSHITQTDASQPNPSFPCRLTIHTPLPTPRLAAIALRALAIDPELSPLVHRSFTLSTPTTLTTYYSATTNRMLRVAVNGFFESFGVVVACMRELDLGMVEGEWVGEAGLDGVGEEGEEEKGVRELRKVQGLEERGVIGRYSEGPLSAGA